jgi:nicotinate phosphoribosyltransferase
MDIAASPLLTDLYQLNMIEAYLANGECETAVFELFFRKLPQRRGFLLAAGLEQALDYLEDLRFSPQDLAWLAADGRFSARLIDYLSNLRFTGDIHAVPEGTVVFAEEPILRVSAPLPEAQLVETRLMNILHFQTLIAAKAARMVLAAPGKTLVDYGLRRAHGAEAGLMAARASYIAGFAGTATVLAQRQFGIPTFGTMAHSFIQAQEDEELAFLRFARARPEHVTLLLDTYDTEAAARKIVEIAPKLAAEGIAVAAVRIDSGDLVPLSKRVRAILDAGGLHETRIIASGGLDEAKLLTHDRDRAPIDGYGLGTSLTTSSDVPNLDCAYKLQEYAGIPRRKHSAGKATWPGRKQIFRHYAEDGSIAGDVLSLENDPQPGEPLLVPVMRGGRRLDSCPALAEIRMRAARDLARLPAALRHLTPGATCPVKVAGAVVRLAEEADRAAGRHAGDRHDGKVLGG